MKQHPGPSPGPRSVVLSRVRDVILGGLMIVLLPGLATPQEAAIQGRVTDVRSGEPLPGANIVIEGSRLGAPSDADGNYRIAVPAELGLLGQTVTLTASYVGYRRLTVDITLESEVVARDFGLTQDVLRLESVVVTGFGTTVSKEKLGVTIDKVSPETISGSHEISVISALAGKIPNVEVTTSSGEPGAAAYIRLRGAHSITGGTQPLIVVDGSPVNNQTIGNSLGGVTQQNRANDINPEDIESIEVLKGAAAAALYGSRAQNGVVLITTKSGTLGRPKLTYRFSSSWDNVSQLPRLQMRWGQGSGGSPSTTSSVSWGPLLDTIPGSLRFDHSGDLFEAGNTLEHDLTLSGGNEMTTYFFSFGRTSVDGVIRGNSDYKRNNVRIKASQRVSSVFNVTGNVSFADVKSNRIQKGSNVSGLLLGGWRTPPDFNNEPFLHPTTGFHRSYRYQSAAALRTSRGYDNPLFVVFENVNVSEVGRAFGNVKVDIDPAEWLNISYTLGHDYSNDERRTVFPPSSSSYPEGRVTRDKFSSQETDGNLVVSTAHRFADLNVGVNLMLGYNHNQRRYNEFSVNGDGMAIYGFNQLDNTSSYDPNEYEYILRSEGIFGQVTVDLSDQFAITGALRNDGSSTFGVSEKRHWYPKVSAAWEFSKLASLQELPFLSFGKVRFAYGEAGQEPGVYSTITAFASGNFGDGWGTSLSSTAYGIGGFFTDASKGQNNILPQRVKETEGGLDIAFLDNLIGLEFTRYFQLTEDAIFSLPLPPSTGATNQVKNAGRIENEGIEIALNTTPINTREFRWDLRLLYAKNTNNVTDLSGAEFVGLGGFTGTSGAAIKGYPLGVLRGTDFYRFGRSSVVGGVGIDTIYSGWRSGDLYIGLNGYPVEDPQLRVVADPNPDWTGSIRSTFTLFGDFEIGAFIDIKQGGEVWNGTKGALVHFGTHSDTELRGTTKTFQGIGPGAGTPVTLTEAWYTGDGGGFNGPASQFIEDGSYVKLREIAIAYRWRSAFVKSLTGLNDIYIRLAGRNLKTWTDYTGIDPETNLSGTTNLQGLDYFNNPQTRSYVLEVRCNY